MDFVYGVLASAAYGAIGVMLMGLGFVVVDLLIPGSLGRQIWIERNLNATLVLAAGLGGNAIIIVTAIMTSSEGLGPGLLSTLVYGLTGLALMAVSFVALDLATPGKLGETIAEQAFHPASLVSAVVHLSVGAIMAAAIS